MFKKFMVAFAVATTTMGMVALPAHAGATPTATAYRTCKQLNAKYPHGVGRKGAKDRTSGKRVTNFTRNNHVYWLYSSSKGKRIRDLDRDNDGIACERR